MWRAQSTLLHPSTKLDIYLYDVSNYSRILIGCYVLMINRKTDAQVISLTFFRYKANRDSMLQYMCAYSVIDQRRRQNLVRTSVTHSPIANCATFCSYHILRSVAEHWCHSQHGIYFSKHCHQVSFLIPNLDIMLLLVIIWYLSILNDPTPFAIDLNSEKKVKKKRPAIVKLKNVEISTSTWESSLNYLLRKMYALVTMVLWEIKT